MCVTGEPATPAAALAMLELALDCLNGADMVSLPAAAQAECLRVLERAGAKHTAARASVLAAFTAQGGFEADGQRCARSWLTWQTQVTGGAAAGAVGWARRLAAHPAVRRALAAGTVSASWAREATFARSGSPARWWGEARQDGLGGIRPRAGSG